MGRLSFSRSTSGRGLLLGERDRSRHRHDIPIFTPLTRDLLRNKCNRTGPTHRLDPTRQAPATKARPHSPTALHPPTTPESEAGNHDIDRGSKHGTRKQYRHGICLQRRAKVTPQDSQQARSYAASKTSRPGVTREMREGREAAPADDASNSICHQTGFEKIPVNLAIHRFSGRRSSSLSRQPAGEWAPKGTEGQGTAP